MTDRPRLDEMLASLRNYVKELQRLGQMDKPEFLANPDAVGSAKYHFIVAIECCIDIANHIIASERLRAPTSYADAFASLQEAGFIQGGTAEGLAQATRFRNRLTHRYWNIDDALVHQFLAEDLHHFLDFAQQVIRGCGASS